jgi:uncharacterized protein
MTTSSVARSETADPREREPASLAPLIQRIVSAISELADDVSVPRNVRRGAQSAIGELAKTNVALDVRVAGAVYVLDDLANDPNLPTHGRTAIWSIISSLESLP